MFLVYAQTPGVPCLGNPEDHSVPRLERNPLICIIDVDSSPLVTTDIRRGSAPAEAWKLAAMGGNQYAKITRSELSGSCLGFRHGYRRPQRDAYRVFQQLRRQLLAASNAEELRHCDKEGRRR